MELKTLKDLKKTDWDSPVGARGDDELWIKTKELKAEAVKWVKDICEKNPNPYGDTDSVHWIKHFFNLTEEDLIY